MQPEADNTAAEPTEPASLAALARYFGWLGWTAFGGPAAHIAIMQEDLVTKRRWLTRQHFLDLLAASQLIPGPTSTELAIHTGYVKRGVAGLFVAGICFILPAFAIVLLLSILYVAYGSLPTVGALFYGIQPVIVAIIIQAIERLARSAWRNWPERAIGIAAAGLALLLPIDPVLLILGGGMIGVALQQRSAASVASLVLIPGVATATLIQPGLWELGLFFLKVGATLMGSGYVLIAYLENDVVGVGWMSSRQLIDAIAVGQMTPGPLFSTAAFVGYVIQAGPQGDIAAGVLGAIICAMAIFLPSFVFVWVSGPWVEKLRHAPAMRAFLDGVNAAVVGTMIATTLTLLRAALINLPQPIWAVPLGSWMIDLPALAILLVATGLLLPKKAANPTLLIVLGALLGVVLVWGRDLIGAGALT
ncbi:MAG: chromate efflux transporter [Roseiflexaceae bacterium]